MGVSTWLGFPWANILVASTRGVGTVQFVLHESKCYYARFFKKRASCVRFQLLITQVHIAYTHV